MVKTVDLDQWTLLSVVMAGQFGGRKEAWTAGFKRVNLHPHHKRPIEVWLSEINQSLVASARSIGQHRNVRPGKEGFRILAPSQVSPFFYKLQRRREG
jgi:hypothetical protein